MLSKKRKQYQWNRSRNEEETTEDVQVVQVDVVENVRAEADAVEDGKAQTNTSSKDATAPEESVEMKPPKAKKRRRTKITTMEVLDKKNQKKEQEKNPEK